MMKKSLIISLSIIFLLGGIAHAQMGMMYNQNYQGAGQQAVNAELNSALQDIYMSQGITSQNDLDCAKITDDQFEQLGDLAMGLGISEQQHEYMDQMMGGEGSDSLRQAHINMGRSYLGCWSNYSSGTFMMPMMGYGYNMMGYNNAGYNNSYPNANCPFFSGMMSGFPYGAGGFSWFGILTMLLFWAVLILAIVGLVKFIKKK